MIWEGQCFWGLLYWGAGLAQKQESRHASHVLGLSLGLTLGIPVPLTLSIRVPIFPGPMEEHPAFSRMGSRIWPL